MSHNHSHSDGEQFNVSARKMSAAVVLTLTFVVGEAAFGFFAHSLALMSDAGHNFADALALGLSWYALWIAKKPAHPGMTYGYHRVGILAALVNSVSLVVIALFIFWEAAWRIQNPEPVNGGLMIGVAAVAVVVNLLIGVWLHADAKHDVNVRSAYLHMVGDAASAFGVVVAGIVVVRTGWQFADPVVSFLIGGLIVWSSWGILKETVNVLLEGTPYGIDMNGVENCITAVQGVLGTHDLHVWTVGPGAIACSCHILVAEQSVRDGQQILKTVAQELENHYRINHCTIQVEVEGHQENDLYCCIKPSKARESETCIHEHDSHGN